MQTQTEYSINTAAPVATPTSTPSPTMEPACGCAVCMSAREGGGDGLGGLDGSKPVWSDDQIVGNFLRSNNAWSPGATITYSFREAKAPNADGKVSFIPLAGIEREFTRLGFDLISDIVNLNFVEAADDYRATGVSDRIYLSKDAASPDFEWGHAQRWTIPTGGVRLVTAAEIYISDKAQAARQWFAGGYNFQALVHEIMHTLGIPHPGNYNANGDPITYGANAEYAQDSRQFSVMSYFTAATTGADFLQESRNNGLYSGSTPLLHDVMALQALYGPNMSTRSGDTVYGFNSTAGRAPYDFDLNLQPIFTIWDGGGRDRIDFSRTNKPVNLDLNPGRFSDAFEMTNNISIALGVTIEEAVGGLVSDRLIGNEASNRLFGGDGDDAVFGRGGDDYLEGGQGRDTLSGDAGNDFLEGKSGDDRLHGQDGEDLIGGQEGDDYLDGGAGQDSLFGDDGNDFLEGKIGNDRLFGQGGDDLIGGQEGDDYVSGGQGRDNLYGDGGNDFLEGGEDGDRLFGQDGDDLIGGQDGADYIGGGAGRDSLFGDAGEDFLEGGADDDRLFGQDGNDLIGGQDGADYLDGGGGDDALYSDGGDDILFGGEGRDILAGGAGRDRFVFSALSQSRPGEPDRILDFDPAGGDLIDLSQLDADVFAPGDQAFSFVAAFSGQSGQAVLGFSNGRTSLTLDVNGDRNGDFALEFDGQFDGRIGFLL